MAASAEKSMLIRGVPDSTLPASARADAMAEALSSRQSPLSPKVSPSVPVSNASKVVDAVAAGMHRS